LAAAPRRRTPIARLVRRGDAGKLANACGCQGPIGNASILGRHRVVFNIKGNAYRLVTALAYNTGIVFVKFIGTHAEYDRIDAETVERR
jgi:mRNA-degrading endonuclease HigB of HigAB toxin-antitoxin module